MRQLLCVGLLALAGCDDHTFPLIGEDGNVGYTPDWTGAQQFFGDHCESCHPSLNDPDLVEAVAADIVDGTGRYVVPGDPQSSELWLVITDQSDQWPIMPLAAAQPLPDEVVQPIADWIAAGAPLE